MSANKPSQIVMSCLPFLRSFIKGILDRRGRHTYDDQPREYQSKWHESTSKRAEAHLESLHFDPRTHASVTKATKFRSRVDSKSDEDVLLEDVHLALPGQVIVKTTAYHVHEERL